MAIDYNINPYYDDFDETKNYHRILFRPGYAVQARELTQLQTQLQDQISKFGKHVFKNGSLVLGGQRSIEDKTLNNISIKLQSTYAGSVIDYTRFQGMTIIGQSSGTKAIVRVAVASTSTDPVTLIIKITSGTAFSLGEDIKTDETSPYTASIQTSGAFNPAMSFSIHAGVFFINGHFIYLEPSSIAVAKYDNTSSWSVGLLINEATITSDQDSSLLDAAQGSPNYTAPGADRYQLTVSLSKLTLDGNGDLVSPPDNYIELARINEGVKTFNQDTTVYSEIAKELARRTFDESGDYTTKAWPINISDHIPPISESADPTLFTVSLDPGKGYVKGYEFATENQQRIAVPRARDTENSGSIEIDLTYGNFLYVSNLLGPFITNADAGSYSTVELHSAARASASSTTKIGTAQVRYIALSSGSPATSTSTIYRMYLFNIQVIPGASFTNVRSLCIFTAGSVSSGADINALSRVGGSGNAFLAGSSSAQLIFPAQNQYIQTLKDRTNATQAVYQTQRYFFKTFTGGKGSIQTNSGNERFEGTGTLPDTTKDIYYHAVVISVSNAGDTTYSAGSVMRFNDSATRTIKIDTPVAGQAQGASFDLNDSSFSGSVAIIATFNVNSLAARVKTRSDYTLKIIDPAVQSLNRKRGGRDDLGVSDIYDVLGVYTTTTNPSGITIDGTTGVVTWGSVVPTPVTGNYQVDNGQRSDYYDHGSLILTGTPPTPTSYLVVVYRNFTHSGYGFLSVDSYSIPYTEIPVFYDPLTGKSYNLRDCVDFRPRRVDGGTGFTYGQVPNTLVPFITDYYYYLNRIDKVIATTDQKFIVKEGIPAVYPQIPSDESNGMTLYTLAVPAYTTDVSQIQIKYSDNKRYTMRDIGNLDTRIKNLEYYTQLSQLEVQAQQISIPDASNFQKFKNGVATDPFTSLDVYTQNNTEWAKKKWSWWSAWFNGNTTWNEYGAQNYAQNSISNAIDVDFHAAVDPVNALLRAPFTTTFTGFNVDSLTNTTTDKKGDLITLSYSERQYISQPNATTYMNVNPFNIIRFFGSVNLSPAFDEWIDTTTLPAVNQIVDLTVKDPDINNTVSVSTNGGWRIYAGSSTSSATTTTTGATQTTTLGTSVVDVQAIPYIRAKTIMAVGKLFKPLARLYPFMENVAVDQYCRSLTLVEVQNHVGTLFATVGGNQEALTFRTGSQSGTVTGNAKAALYSSPKSTDPTRRLLWIFDTSGTITTGKYVVGANGGYGLVTAVTTYALGDAIVPDEYGNIAAEFHLPANTFATGERTFRLIDNTTNDIQAQDSIGEAKYTATGLLQTKQTTLLTTRVLHTQTINTTTQTYYDPLAQTFLVDELSAPAGLHVTSVDLYFRNKSKNVPVTLQIRSTVNGYPKSISDIPFNEVTIYPEDVNTSTLGTVPTTFHFPNPLQLTPGEYSLVVISNSADYEVFIGQNGQTVLGGTAIVSASPNIGSLFISQNGSTWIPDQNKALKFAIKSAQFASSGIAEFSIDDPETLTDYHTLYMKASSFAPTGTNITWQAKAYYADSTFDTDWAPINLNQDINYTFLRRLAAASGIGGTPSFRVQAVMTTDNSQVSPAIDFPSMAIVTAINKINNDASTETYHDIISFNAAVAVNTTANSITYNSHPYVTGDLVQYFGYTDIGFPPRILGSKTNSDALPSTSTAIYADAWIALDTGHVWEFNGTAWVDVGLPIAPLVDTASYYVIKVDSNTIKLAASLFDADGNTPIDLTNVGVGTHKLKKPTQAGGTALARYITKPINLASGFDATNLCVTVDANLPTGTSIAVYHRFVPSGSITPIVDEYWQQMIIDPTITLTPAANSYDYTEVKYFPQGAFDVHGIPTDGPIEPKFTTFQVKIVLLSPNVVQTPMLKNLRIIALHS